jgi:hypothetical protein
MKVTKFMAEFLSEKKQYPAELTKAKFPVLRHYFPSPLLTPVYLHFGLFFNKFNESTDPLLPSRLLPKTFKDYDIQKYNFACCFVRV